MNDTRYDVIVLGAGMVGSATAAQLAMRGASVALVDRQPPGEATSYGNAGMIETTAFAVTAFPRHLPSLMNYVLGKSPHLNFHMGFLPRVAPWLLSYWQASSPQAIVASAERLAPLSRFAVGEHRMLAEAAGSAHLIRYTGSLRLYHTDQSLIADRAEHELMLRYGVALQILDAQQLASLEPNLRPGLRAAFAADAASSSDPGALTKSYAELAFQRGATFVSGDANRLGRAADGWALPTGTGTIRAPQVVVALGPWAKEFLASYHIRVPIAVKRGYHMHFAPQGNAALSRPAVDADGGYCLTPTTKGIRMTTGAEFADRDAPATPVQVDASEVMARQIFPLAERVEPRPWLGRRPNTPDGVPIIGMAPGQPGMWLAVGHGHWGFCLGPATGRLIAEMMAGTELCVDPRPLSLARFGR